MKKMEGEKVAGAMKAHAKRVGLGVTFYIAELPDAYGYGVIGYGLTPQQAEAACRKEYRRNNHGPGTGWHAQPWPQAKEEWGFHITQATTGTAHLIGCGEEA